MRIVDAKDSYLHEEYVSKSPSPLPSNSEQNSDTEKKDFSQEKKTASIAQGYKYPPEAIINRLHEQHLRLFTFSSLFKIYQKFLSHHWMTLSVMALVITTLQVALNFIQGLSGIKSDDSLINSLNVGFLFLMTIAFSMIGSWISRQFLLTPHQKASSSIMQGFGSYLVYNFSIACFALMSVFFIYFIPNNALQYLAIACSIFVASVVISQYGLILPAISAERKTSSEIASQQIKPMFFMTVGVIAGIKIIPFLSFILLYEAFGDNLISISIKSFLNCLSDFSIYVVLCAVYAGSGYLMNSEFKRDDEV